MKKKLIFIYRISTVLLLFLILSILIYGIFLRKIKNPEILTVFKDKNDFIQIDDEPRKFDNEEKNTIDIYDRLSSAVVNITFYKTEYIRYFFEIYPQTSEGQGSGVIIDKRGYIITNFHVVGNADKLKVTLSKNEDAYEAEIIGTDPENDLALIKIKDSKREFNIIPMGRSDDLKVGQKVYAIGNPFGLDRTLTSGIISGLGRPVKTENGNVIEDAIQTDASINPGNSGGPLIDSSGKLIGINSMIISPSGGSVGLGFAIPIKTIQEITDELFKNGYVKRGWIDATFLPITPGIAKELGYPVDHGLMVMTVSKGGEAFKSGLRGGTKQAVYYNNVIYIGGELIISVDGIVIKDYSDFVRVLKNKKPGDSVNIEYYKGIKKSSAQIKLIDKRKFVNQ